MMFGFLGDCADWLRAAFSRVFGVFGWFLVALVFRCCELKYKYHTKFIPCMAACTHTRANIDVVVVDDCRCLLCLLCVHSMLSETYNTTRQKRCPIVCAVWARALNADVGDIWRTNVRATKTVKPGEIRRLSIVILIWISRNNAPKSKKKNYNKEYNKKDNYNWFISFRGILHSDFENMISE